MPGNLNLPTDTVNVMSGIPLDDEARRRLQIVVDEYNLFQLFESQLPLFLEETRKRVQLDSVLPLFLEETRKRAQLDSVLSIFMEEVREGAQLIFDEEKALQSLVKDWSRILEEESERHFYETPDTNSLENLVKHEANIRKLIINRMMVAVCNSKHSLRSSIIHKVNGQFALKSQDLSCDASVSFNNDQSLLAEQVFEMPNLDNDLFDNADAHRVMGRDVLENQALSYTASVSFNNDQGLLAEQVFEMHRLDNDIFDILGAMKAIFMAEVAELNRQLKEARTAKLLLKQPDAETQTDPIPVLNDSLSPSEMSRSLSNGPSTQECDFNPVPRLPTIGSDSALSSSSYKIFAYMSDMRLLQSTSLVTINIPETELSPPNLKKMRESSLLVKSPSGHLYSLSEGRDGQKPKAEMTEEQAKPDPNDSSEQSHLRLAQTIINMIDNVLSRSDVIDVKTSNPFVAAIASEYISYIKSRTKDVITSEKIICSMPSPTADDNAKKVFAGIRLELEKLNYPEKNPALHYRPLFEQLKHSERGHIVDVNLSSSDRLLETSKYVEKNSALNYRPPFEQLKLSEKVPIVDVNLSLSDRSLCVRC